MIKILQKIILVLTTLFIASCATQGKYKEILNSWVGSSESSLISSWGIPSSVYETNGLKYLTFRNNSTGYLPGTPGTAQTTIIGNTAYTNYYGGTSGVMLNFNCETTFVVSDGVISNWSYRGNACVAK